jgi:hypothetical protein
MKTLPDAGKPRSLPARAFQEDRRMRIVLALALAGIASAGQAQTRGFETRDGCLRQLSMAISSVEAFEGSASIIPELAKQTPAADAEHFPDFVEGLRMVANGWRMQRDALMSICESYPR